jgi:hypothetical protein
MFHFSRLFRINDLRNRGSHITFTDRYQTNNRKLPYTKTLEASLKSETEYIIVNEKIVTN